MGNEAGKPTCPLGLAAMSATTSNIEINEISELFKKCYKVSQASGTPESISRVDLEAALKGIENFQPSDCELLDKMFTMFDNSGEGIVDLREYSVAVATLISGNPSDKLKFAFKMFDIDKVGTVTRGEMKKVLHAINNVASYFGDAVITAEDIDLIVLDVFEKASVSSVVIEKSIAKITAHASAEKFLNAQGTVRFGR